MTRSYFDAAAPKFIATDSSEILGILAAKEGERGFAIEPGQSAAWAYQIEHLKLTLSQFKSAHVFFEFSIPRMGRRADVIILLHGMIFVLEYKVGQTKFLRQDIEQTVGYALDLSHFHETSHDRMIIPVLIATGAVAPQATPECEKYPDNVATVVRTNEQGLAAVLSKHSLAFCGAPLVAAEWSAGRFKPTPTIVEAAQALYRHHNVEEITRNEAGAENLSVTSKYIEQVISDSRQAGIKSICFVTGVPGSGKTLAGLTIANSRMDAQGDNHAVFLSGNGPLVSVLREALTQDRLMQEKREASGRCKTKAEVEAATHAFIQNIHHYRDENIRTNRAPVDRIAVFDEAQRAWNAAQTTEFMRKKRGQLDFAMSEPDLLLSIMDRHEGWATVICLVGGGQEINTGEAGIGEWISALRNKFACWHIHLPEQVAEPEYLDVEQIAGLRKRANTHWAPALHLAVSLRSFRAESLSRFVGSVLGNDRERAKQLMRELTDFPLYITRDLSLARRWIRERRRGPERSGLLASSNALRLKPEGIFVKATVDPRHWFLARSDDIRSSTALEDAATEFDVQGLELDWACVAWDANLRRENGRWAAYAFKGTTWQNIKQDDRAKYLLNSYRVLLTRARQGMVIFVPKGEAQDTTRLPSMYDAVYWFLKQCGISELPLALPTHPEFTELGADPLLEFVQE